MTTTPDTVLDTQEGNRSVPPAIAGLHHLTLDVDDLEASRGWFGRVLGASHLENLDHYDDRGIKYAVILKIPGLIGVIQLRQATDQLHVQKGYDPITFEVADVDALNAWLRHLDSCAVKHSPISRRKAGNALDFFTPDGIILRLYANFAPAEQK
ncbi:VOC family protein [Pseudarthrobacter raffinosi]|uniref:VOC family protein n=1 Tax=Pseudarthrobacter raffinosi TaxID=2953651 RepID=UPI00208E362F|nr:VOC family protein [Pseudarthrobacter sp. MDT3-9]MCO4252113.1 VOC family protein [Pseudarthrobacter sp. MDT3-9]